MDIEGVILPPFLYGTAWKEDDTQQLTTLALRQGFRGIDTANQRKHYFEAGVGAALAAAVDQGLLTRDDLFLQTKFTFRRGQDQRLPYDPMAPIGRQVEQSFRNSLEHLGVQHLDSYVLHGPSSGEGLTKDDWSAWRAIEALHAAGSTRLIGVSNVSLEQLQLFCANAVTPPHFVQNRCFAVLGWDREVRQFCRANGIVYQGFSLLTANREVVNSAAVQEIAQRHGRTPAQIIFRFALDVGMLPLTGTTNAEHMRQDLESIDIQLVPAEVELLERLAVHRWHF